MKPLDVDIKKSLDVKVKRLGREREMQKMKSLNIKTKPTYNKRDMQVAEIKKFYHEKAEYRWEGTTKPCDVKCRYCGDRKLKRKEICPSLIRKWSSSKQAAFSLFEELPLPTHYKKYINEYDEKVHEVRIPTVFQHKEFKGESFADVVTQAYIFYKKREK